MLSTVYPLQATHHLRAPTWTE